jgi:hypothetical protein
MTHQALSLSLSSAAGVLKGESSGYEDQVMKATPLLRSVEGREKIRQRKKHEGVLEMKQTGLRARAIECIQRRSSNVFLNLYCCTLFLFP